MCLFCTLDVLVCLHSLLRTLFLHSECTLSHKIVHTKKLYVFVHISTSVIFDHEQHKCDIFYFLLPFSFFESKPQIVFFFVVT